MEDMKKVCFFSPNHLHITCMKYLDLFDLVNSIINTCIILVNVLGGVTCLAKHKANVQAMFAVTIYFGQFLFLFLFYF